MGGSLSLHNDVSFHNSDIEKLDISDIEQLDGNISIDLNNIELVELKLP